MGGTHLGCLRTSIALLLILFISALGPLGTITPKHLPHISAKSASTLEITVNNASTTLTPSQTWVEVQATHQWTTDNPQWVAFEFTGTNKTVQVYCNQNGNTLEIIQGPTNLLNAPPEGMCTVSHIQGDALIGKIRFQVNSSWDDEDDLDISGWIELGDGTLSTRRTQKLGVAGTQGVENDLVMIPYARSGSEVTVPYQLVDDQGRDIGEDQSQLKAGTEIGAHVRLGFENVEETLHPRNGEVLVELLANGAPVANTTSISEGWANLTWTLPPQNGAMTLGVSITPLYGGEHVSHFETSRSFLVDSSQPILIGCQFTPGNSTLSETGHREASTQQGIECTIADLPNLPRDVYLNLWRVFEEDTNPSDGIAQASEFIQIPMTTPTELDNVTNGTYTATWDDSAAFAGDLVIGWFSGEDNAGNSLRDGGGPEHAERYFEYRVQSDRAPVIDADAAQLLDGDDESGPWLHPDRTYTFVIPIEEPNGLMDLSLINISLDGNDPNDSLAVRWEPGKNTCGTETTRIEIIDCKLVGSDGAADKFTEDVEFVVEIRIPWDFPQVERWREPRVRVIDKEQKEDFVSLRDLRWRFSPELGIIAESIDIQASSGTIVGLDAWVRPGTEIELSGSVRWTQSLQIPREPIDLLAILGTNRTTHVTENGSFQIVLIAPTTSETLPLLCELANLPFGGIDETIPELALRWIVVDAGGPIPAEPTSPRSGGQLHPTDLEHIEVQWTIQEDGRLDPSSVFLQWRLVEVSGPEEEIILQGVEEVNLPQIISGLAIPANATISTKDMLPPGFGNLPARLEVWVTGVDVAGNEIISNWEMNSKQAPLGLWTIYHRQAEFQVTRDDIALSKTGIIKTSEPITIVIDTHNVGERDGDVEVEVFARRAGEPLDDPIDLQRLTIPSGGEKKFQSTWTPKSTGTWLVVVKLEDGTEVSSSPLVIIPKEEKTQKGALAEVQPAYLWVIAGQMLLLVAILVAAFLMRQPSESIWGDEIEDAYED